MDRREKDLLKAQLLIEAADILNETNNSVVSKNIAFLKQFGYKELSDNEKEELKKSLNMKEVPKNMGRIKVDGKEFIANPGAYTIDYNNNKLVNASERSPNLYSGSKEIINLGGKKFSNMSDDEKKYTLYHEVGHSKLMHTKNVNTTHALMDAKKTADEHIFKERAVRKNEKDENNKRLGKEDNYQNTDDYLNAKKRYDNMPRLSKYTRKSLGDHSNQSELEADIYSIEHSKANPKAIASTLSSLSTSKYKQPYGRRHKLNNIEKSIEYVKNRKESISDYNDFINDNIKYYRNAIEEADENIKDLKKKLKEKGNDASDRDYIISHIDYYEKRKKILKDPLRRNMEKIKFENKKIKAHDSEIKNLNKDRKKYLGMSDEEFNTYMKKRNEKNTKKYLKKMDKDAKLRTKAVLDKKIDHAPYK